MSRIFPLISLLLLNAFSFAPKKTIASLSCYKRLIKFVWFVPDQAQDSKNVSMAIAKMHWSKPCTRAVGSRTHRFFKFVKHQEGRNNSEQFRQSFDELVTQAMMLI